MNCLQAVWVLVPSLDDDNTDCLNNAYIWTVCPRTIPVCNTLNSEHYKQ